MSCSSCYLDLRGVTFVKCAECVVPSVELCYLCFYGKVKVGNHSSNHSYHVLQGSDLSDFSLHGQPLWRQLGLLDSSRSFSVGSWLKVSERAQLDTPSQCESEFARLYSMWNRFCHDNFPELSFQLNSSSLRPLSVPEVQGIQPSIFMTPASADLPGFIMNRGDFEVEYDDSAELGLADIEFQDDDTPEDVSVKLACLRAYDDRMRRREEVKKFVFRANITNVQGQLDAHSCRTADEIDLRAKLRPVERFFDKEGELDAFVQLILVEKRILERIKNLKVANISQGVVDPAPSITSVENEGGKEGFSQRPFTRSRSGTDVKRARSVEEGCSRISNALEATSVRERLQGELDSIESEMAQKIGIDPVTFSIIRDVTQQRALAHGASSMEASVKRFGSLLSFQSTF